MFERLMALYDFSWTGRQALEWALRASEAFHSRLKVVHVSPGGRDEPDPEALRKAIREEIDREVRKTSEGPAPSLEKLEVEVRVGHVVSMLTEGIARENPDLVVLGTHGWTGLLHVLLGSIAEKIVRHSPSPVLVVRGASRWPPKCLLLPLEFDESADEALLAAAELRKTLNLRVEALHVIEPPIPLAYPPEAVIGLPLFDSEAAEKEAGERLKELVGAHPLLSIVSYVTSGQPAAKICEKARGIGADFILIPTHGRSAVGRLLIGSVAEQVVRYAPCHVLSFRPGKFLNRRGI